MSIVTDASTIRDAVPEDFGTLVALNNAAVPAVNTLGEADFATFSRAADVFRVLGPLAQPYALMIALEPGRPYDSPNYRWFEARYSAFLYVDRIIVDPGARSGGIGAALYDDLEAVARRNQVPRLACEVNLRPPNERSVRFHERIGFRAVGTQDTEGGAKSVQLMVRELT